MFLQREREMIQMNTNDIRRDLQPSDLYALTVLKEFRGSATLWPKVIMKFTKMLIT